MATSTPTPLIAPATETYLDFAIHPNPAINKITLEISKQQETIVKIYNLQGICITETSGNELINIDISLLPSGIYLITTSANNWTSSTQKFIKL
ncbi:MAG: T9SS type A sorting domain-containing protein [Prevotellaceae bacterium]|nr:T9SS type A sorting domain-containing protein [Prevotellaceae bacterium]